MRIRVGQIMRTPHQLPVSGKAAGNPLSIWFPRLKRVSGVSEATIPPFNSVTEPYSYPVPHIQDRVAVLYGKKNLLAHRSGPGMPTNSGSTRRRAQDSPKINAMKDHRLPSPFYCPLCHNISPAPHPQRGARGSIGLLRERREGFNSVKGLLSQAAITAHPASDSALALMADASTVAARAFCLRIRV